MTILRDCSPGPITCSLFFLKGEPWLCSEYVGTLLFKLVMSEQQNYRTGKKQTHYQPYLCLWTLFALGVLFGYLHMYVPWVPPTFWIGLHIVDKSRILVIQEHLKEFIIMTQNVIMYQTDSTTILNLSVIDLSTPKGNNPQNSWLNNQCYKCNNQMYSIQDIELIHS